MEYSISEIAAITGATVTGSRKNTISELLIDSRRLTYPEKTLFFAFRTKANDGHKYIKDLYMRNVRNFMVSELPEDTSAMPEANFLLTENPLDALQKLASFHRKKFAIPVAAITGSNGKTIVKEFLYQLLKEDLNIMRSPRSYNSQIGVPLSVWGVEHTHELAIFEAGISKPGEMKKISDIILPDTGIITGIGDAHQENFSTVEEKCEEKCILFENSSTIIFCSDNRTVSEYILDRYKDRRLFFWSRENKEAPLFVESVVKNDSSTTIGFIFDGTRYTLSIPFQDDASVEDSIHSLAFICALYPDKLERILPRFTRLEPVAMRLDVVPGQNNCLIINDSYNSDINSLDIALDFQQSRRKGKKMKTTLILSDILQSGSSPDELYRKVAKLLAAKNIERLIGIGHEISAHRDYFSMEKEFYPTTEEFIRTMHGRRFSDELILLKGSRIFHFESISERLEKKVHETILEVNLDAVIHNFNFYRSKLKTETKMVCMVKAFAYGAGSYELAKTLQDQHCDYLAVAVADEGVELRKEGITLPIMVMNPEFGSFNTLLEYNLEPEIYSFRLLDAFSDEAERRGINSFPIHIKVDTGMHRLGFRPSDMKEVSLHIGRHNNAVAVKSVFSHLAGSDSPEFDEFTHLQLDRFIQATSALEKDLGYKVIKHILNSAGIERFTEYQMDMVRLGIGLYGISASGMDGLRPVSRLKTTILQIQEVPAGDSIGYSRRSFVDRDSRIAIIPIGYADGLDRHFSNRHGHVLVNGKKCPIIGNICMDACMIDVTDTDAREGDSVIVFGEELPVSSLSDELGTIPYEILTSVSPRVKRIYYRE